VVVIPEDLTNGVQDRFERDPLYVVVVDLVHGDLLPPSALAKLAKDASFSDAIGAAVEEDVPGRIAGIGACERAFRGGCLGPDARCTGGRGLALRGRGFGASPLVTGAQEGLRRLGGEGLLEESTLEERLQAGALVVPKLEARGEGKPARRLIHSR
jgi:hypothetical protein